MDGKSCSAMGARWMGDVIMGWKVRPAGSSRWKKELITGIHRY